MSDVFSADAFLAAAIDRLQVAFLKTRELCRDARRSARSTVRLRRFSAAVFG